MIAQEKYWRQDLKKIAISLEKRYRQIKWNVISEYKTEKEIFIGFFIVRKLIENNYVPKSLVGRNYKFAAYPYSTIGGFMMDKKHFLYNYKIFKGSEISMSIKAICDQFIHSSYFYPNKLFNRGMFGIYFCSDRAKPKYVYYIQLIKIIEIFMSVSTGYHKPLKLKIENGQCFTNINEM